jgi:CheY-like chemotaxis protein
LTLPTTGRTACNAAANGDHDLVILDVMLPRIDGFGVLSALRTSRQVPVLMLTALSRTDGAVRLPKTVTVSRTSTEIKPSRKGKRSTADFTGVDPVLALVSGQAVCIWSPGRGSASRRKHVSPQGGSLVGAAVHERLTLLLYGRRCAHYRGRRYSESRLWGHSLELSGCQAPTLSHEVGQVLLDLIASELALRSVGHKAQFARVPSAGLRKCRDGCSGYDENEGGLTE